MFRRTRLDDFFLDTSWPYMGPYGAPGGSSDNVEMVTDDSPSYEIISWSDHVEVSDDFRMFEIFEPPYGPGMHGTAWVSLHVLNWHWEGNGDEGGGNVWTGPNGLVIALNDEDIKTGSSNGKMSFHGRTKKEVQLQ